MTRRQAAGLALLAACLSATLTAQATGVRIAPVVVELPSARQPGVIQLTNESDVAKTYQGEALRWTQAEGKDAYEPTDELVVVPPIAQVAPGATQVFRVMLREPVPAPAERTYRLVLEDITPAASDGSAIAFRYAHNLPVLVAPAAKAAPAIRWSDCTADGAREACVRLENAGNRRVKLQKIAVQGKGWQQAVDLGAGFNLLAGASRTWSLPRQAATAVDTLTVEAQQAPDLQLQRASR